ncbi:MAG: NVEALA domain-containing protein [Tannerellaceae bacterium]|jgi:hypothetical protein|nr:NVEALA domain-containing protein [Tannerellaceae bacterium]
MKKRILSITFVTTIAVTSAWNIYQTNKEIPLSDLALANIEALANETAGGGSGCKWKLIDCPGLWTGSYEACLVNGDGNSCSCGIVTRDCK